MDDSNNRRRSLSASPSAIRSKFAAESAAPATSTTTATTATTTTTTAATTSTASSSTRGKSTDVGVTKLPTRISQNDERLPHRTPSVQPSSGSDGSAGNTSISLLPSLDESPASQLPSGVFTQVTIEGSSQTQRVYEYYEHGIDTSDSQDLAHLGHPDIASGPDIDNSFHFAHPDDPANTSNTSNTSNQSSSSSRSKRANTSIHSQDGKDGASLSSSDPNSSGSAESQVSDMSFGNVATSSPHQTPNRSDTSTQSSDRSISNPPSQASPSSRRNPGNRSLTQESNSTQGSSSGSSQQRGGPSRGAGASSVSTHRPSQLASPERIPGTDPSILTQTQDADEIVEGTPTNYDGDDQEGVNSRVRNAFAEKSSSLGSTPPAALSTRVTEPSQSQRRGTQTAEKDPSLVDVGSDDEEIDQSLSQSQAGNYAHSLSKRRRAQESSSTIKERTTSAFSSSTTATTAVKTTTSISTSAASTSNTGSKKRSSVDEMLTQIPEDEVSYVSESEHVSEKSTLSASSPHNTASSSRDDISSPSGPQGGSLPSPPVRAAASATRITAPHRSVRPNRSPPFSRTESDELPSSQGSRGFHSSSGGSFVDKCLAAANQERQGSESSGPVLSIDSDSATPLLAIPKKRRVLSQAEQGAQSKPSKSSEQPKHVPSSMEDEFWEGTERDDRPAVARSRSRSQDISSFPNDLTSELEEPLSDHQEGGDDAESQTTAGPSTPTLPRTPPSKALPRPVTSQSRNLRRRSGQHQPSSSPTTSPRRSVRRQLSVVNDLRQYKKDDAVWAKWKKQDYYAGVVIEKKAEKFKVFFLDSDHGDCEASEMRPLKLKLGAEVLAQKTEAYYPAIVEGMHMSSMLDQSRVDVRFTHDNVEGNYPLSKICLTTDMMFDLDKALAMDVDETVPSLPQTRQLRGPSREASLSSLARKTVSPSVSPQKTPTKGKGRPVPLSQRTLSSLSVGSTPSRRDKVVPNAGAMTPSRRSKELFKDYTFVLSLSGGPGGSQELEREVTNKIKAGGGEVLESFAALDQQRRSSGKVLLIAVTHLRTPKYMEALALNIPRLSYRWIDACTVDRQPVLQSSYLLPSGLSKELDTVISAVPAHPDRRIFEDVAIGICGTRAFRDHWERTLIGAGAKVEIVSGKTGPRNCAYVVFQNLKAHEKYSQSQQQGQQTELPKLSTEWLVQCLINQRIVSIHGHPVYTELAQ
ncbi:hypothetical protein MVEG_01130 [Podila verticillata NRRL 6337]|nr:hypothetical protein MVEG_01130 [Podila verticillata NRRL 6337]